MVPVGIVAKCVAIKSGVIEIVQTVEILPCELVVSELVVAKLVVGGKRVVTSVCAASRKAVTTPSMTHATMGSKSMVPTESAMPATTTAPAVKSAASTPTAMPGDCRDVRHDAKRAHRDACRQNAYRSLLHGTFPHSKF
jgi:hypothetical protein